MIGEGYSHKSIDSFEYAVKAFLDWLEYSVIDFSTLSHQSILEYIDHLQKRQLSPHTINMYIVAIKHYLRFVDVKVEMVDELRVRNTSRRILTVDVVPYDQLKSLYDAFPSDTKYLKRNRIVLSLLIYQALTTRDITQLRVQDMDMEKSELTVPPTRTSSGRTLKLNSKQMLPLHEYLSQGRVKFLMGYPETDSLFPTSSNILRLFPGLLRQVNKLDSTVTSCRQIRASIINYWLHHYSLRQVQYMAGHKHVSSTEAYLDQDLVELENELEVFHPLNY